MHGDPARKLVVRETRAAQDRRLRYLFETVDVRRARRNVETLHELYADAPFDYADLGFTFSNGLVEALELNEHLSRVA